MSLQVEKVCASICLSVMKPENISTDSESCCYNGFWLAFGWVSEPHDTEHT